MRIDFIKCHGSGNDFALIDARGAERDGVGWAPIARALADRRGPVGSDGLLLLVDGDEQHAFGMKMFNSDGSEAETCLNGLRCVARAGFEALRIDQALVRLKTSSAEVRRDPDLAPGVTTIGELAGPASLDVDDWPMVIGRPQNIEMAIPGLGAARAFTAVAIANPHLIAFVASIDEAELVTAGEACEAAPEWLPNRANVSFVEVRGERTLFVRTFERGVGLTDSCGSAMAASLFAAGLTERLAFGREATILNRGGLVKGCAAADGMVRLSGNANYDWAGSAEIDPARGVAGDVMIARRFDAEAAAWTRVVDAIG